MTAYLEKCPSSITLLDRGGVSEGWKDWAVVVYIKHVDDDVN